MKVLRPGLRRVMWIVLAVFGVLVARELGAWDVNWNRSQARFMLSPPHDLEQTYCDAPPSPLPLLRREIEERRPGGHFSGCVLSCRPTGAICDVIAEALSCWDDQSWERFADRRVSLVRVEVEHGGAPFCFTPLYKSGQLDYTVLLSIYDNVRLGDLGMCTRWEGFVHRRTKGIGSCRAFRKLLGRWAAQDIAREVRGHLDLAHGD